MLAAAAVAALTPAFTSTAALFAAMSLIGLTTKMDLTKIGTYALFALVGLILSYAGVLIFSALTAYDTQKISRMASDPQGAAGGTAALRRLSILGVLSLYLDFLNMLLFLLRIFGRRQKPLVSAARQWGRRRSVRPGGMPLRRRGRFVPGREVGYPSASVQALIRGVLGGGAAT